MLTQDVSKLPCPMIFTHLNLVFYIIKSVKIYNYIYA